MLNATQVLGIDGMIILERILQKECGKLWTGFICIRIETSGGCEHGNEPSFFINGGEFVWLSDY